MRAYSQATLWPIAVVTFINFVVIFTCFMFANVFSKFWERYESEPPFAITFCADYGLIFLLLPVMWMGYMLTLVYKNTDEKRYGIMMACGIALGI